MGAFLNTDKYVVFLKRCRHSSYKSFGDFSSVFDWLIFLKWGRGWGIAEFFVFILVCVCACVCLCVCACVRACACIHACTCDCVRMWASVCVHVCVRACVCVCVFIQIIVASFWSNLLSFVSSMRRHVWECLAEAYLHRGSFTASLKAFGKAAEVRWHVIFECFVVSLHNINKWSRVKAKL